MKSCCRCIEDILHSLHLRCHWLHSITWKLCARCDLCLGEREGDDGCSWHHIPSCLHPDCAHFIPLGPDRPLRCEQTIKARTLLDEDKLKPWIKVHTYALHFSCKLLNLYSSSAELKQRNTGFGTDTSVANSTCSVTLVHGTFSYLKKKAWMINILLSQFHVLNYIPSF